MYKYFLSFVIFFGVCQSAFAGTDTDAICADDNIHGLIYKQIQVSYPGETISVDYIYKKNDAPESLTQQSESLKYNTLYYVVNIGKQKPNPSSEIYGDPYSRAELYAYNCRTKSVKQLLKLSINPSIEDLYNVEFIDGQNLVLVSRRPGMSIGGIGTIIGYNITSSKKIFTIKNTMNLPSNTIIDGFVSGKGMWYMYFNTNPVGELFSIDKKTKKITKL